MIFGQIFRHIQKRQNLTSQGKPLYKSSFSPFSNAKNAPPIILYTASTPNGHKASITLEELGLDYEVKALDFSKNEQKEPWFLQINPNGRIPALVDRSNHNFAVFESGAMMLYLVEKYDREHRMSFPHGSDLYWQMVAWLFFQNAGVGPMQGQANHFYRYAPEMIEYGISRYQNETRRLYSVLENRLKENGNWLVGDKLTIADIANYGWVNMAFWAGVEIKEFQRLDDWCERISAREAVKRGLDVPTPFEKKKKYYENKEAAEAEFRKGSSWILKGQEEDAKKKY